MNFFNSARRARQSFDRPEVLDAAAADWMAELAFARKKGPHEGDYLLSGLLHLFPYLRGKLPLCARAIASWKRLVGSGGEGGPMSHEAVISISLELARRGYLLDSVVVLLADDCYLRGQDWQGLRGEDISVSDAGVSLLFGVRERGEKVKTGSNQGVVIEMDTLKYVLQELKSITPRGSLVFPTEGTVFRRRFHEAAVARGLGFVGPPHNLRHSKPARDLAQRVRDTEGVRRRGRWASPKIIERYAKEHWLIRHRSMLPRDVKEEGREFLLNPAAAWGQAILSSQGHQPCRVAKALLRALAASRSSNGFGSVTLGGFSPRLT